METRRRRRLQISASESTTDIRIKFTRLVSRQEELKVAFNQLKSQIKIGLAEAEDVFASLAVPLMKLVGLKTEEMADEGRFTTIIVDNDLSPNMLRNGLLAESPVISPTADGGEWNNQIHRKEESCATKFKIAREEFFEKQKSQLMQLVHLLRQVENRVNFHQDDILQGLTSQRGSLQKLFQKLVYCISSFHSQNNDTFLITLKLLQVLFEKTDEVLCSVEDGMQGLMQDLTEQMCNPMVEYVKSLKADLKTGTCANLLAVVDEMECSTRNGRIELEDVRKRLRVAEEGRIKALCQLKETEGKLRRMKEYQEFLAEIQQGHMEHLVSRKFLGMEEAEANSNKLVWELQRKMRSFRSPGSSMGPNDILFNGSNMKHHQSTKGRPSFSNRPVIVSHLQSSRIPSGLSPSCAIQQVNSRKCISPRLLNP